MKLGIIRCLQTEEVCPGTTDFKVVREKKGAFKNVEGDIEMIGFINCGGCPGKKAVFRARELVKRGADTIALASCITLGTPMNVKCPFAFVMKNAIEQDLQRSGAQVRLIDYTHAPPPWMKKTVSF